MKKKKRRSRVGDSHRVESEEGVQPKDCDTEGRLGDE